MGFFLFAHFFFSPRLQNPSLQNSTWNLGFDFCCCCETSSTRQKQAETGSGPLLFFDEEEELGAAEVQSPESAREPSVPKSTVAGSGSSAPRGGGAWVSMRALASAAEAEALFLVVLVVVVKEVASEGVESFF